MTSQNLKLFREQRIQKSGENPRSSSGKNLPPDDLAQSEPWQAAFDSLNDAVWLMDADCHILRCNQAARNLFGKDAGEIIGRRCWEVGHGTQGPVHGCPMSRMGRSRRRESMELPLEQRWYEVTVDPLFDGSGNFSGAIHVLRDITERKQTEQALQTANEQLTRRLETRAAELQAANGSLLDSERKLRALIETAPVAIAMFDREMRYLAASRRWLQDYGLEDREVVGESHYDFFPEIPDRWKADHRRGLAGEVVWNEEDRFERGDGSVQWLRWEVRPWLVAEDKVGGIIIFTEDITRRKRAEEAVTRSEQHFRLLFETMLQGVIYRDAAGRIIAMNFAAERILGKTLAEILFGPAAVAAEHGARREDGTPLPDLEQPWQVALQAGREVRDVVMGVYNLREQAYRWINCSAVPVFRPGEDQPCQVYTIFDDITGRKQDEESLRQSEKRLRSTLDNMVEGCQIIGFDLTCLYVNASAATQRWHTREEMIGRKITEVFPGIENTKDFGELCRCLEQRAAHSMETEFFLPDGRKAVFDMRLRPVPEGIFVLSYDITERKQAEHLLHHANRTLQAIRACHEAMLRATTEMELLEEICRIIVTTGGERMAWVGFAEKNAIKTVRPVAEAGVNKDCVARAHISWADTPRGRGPVGTAIRSGKVCLCQNTQTDPDFAPWREGARQCGYGSVIALPLMVEKKCLGALAIYAPEPDAFDAGEQLLLTDLANDLAFGITTLRLRAERERLENEILQSIEQEQERIGRDLHDGICQELVGAKFRSVYLEKILADKFPDAAQEAKAMEDMLNHAIEQARDLARGLNPVKVTPDGLISALQRLADNVIVEGAAGPRCFCHFPKAVRIADHKSANHLYRIAQEAVQNAVKHADAKNISITLARQNRRVTLIVKDDGKGLPSKLKTTGMGLDNMRTRAALIGGTLEIRRRKHGGTAVTCVLSPTHRKQP